MQTVYKYATHCLFILVIQRIHTSYLQETHNLIKRVRHTYTKVNWSCKLALYVECCNEHRESLPESFFPKQGLVAQAINKVLFCQYFHHLLQLWKITLCKSIPFLEWPIFGDWEARSTPTRTEGQFQLCFLTSNGAVWKFIFIFSFSLKPLPAWSYISSTFLHLTSNKYSSQNTPPQDLTHF